ncbi:MAG: response regulator [Phycisphaerae bacterium]
MSPSLLHAHGQVNRLRILLAEDSQVYEILAMKILRFYGGHRVCVITKSSEAADLLEREQIDLAVIDLQMAGQEAVQTAECIRSHDASAGGKTPIIGISGNDLPGQEQLCTEAGMDYYVARPFVSDHLSRQVKQLAEQLNQA